MDVEGYEQGRGWIGEITTSTQVVAVAQKFQELTTNIEVRLVMTEKLSGDRTMVISSGSP